MSFEEAAFLIEKGMTLDVLQNPSGKYKDQKIALIELDNYVYVVPFIEEKDKILLKTIFPSRKYTKEYLEGRKKNERPIRPLG